MDLSQSRTIKGYDLIDQIGEGAYGAVFRARQQFVEREVAIKVILPQYANQPDFIRRFETEAQLVAQLEHLHIVPLYDYWRDPEGAYLVMRLMKGGSLADSIAQHGPWEPRAAANLLNQVASALDAAHRKGVIHRDLKPANILLDEDGNAYLSDFGIAKAVGAQAGQTATGAIVGTPAYISPEQAQSLPLAPQTDIYTLGVTLYELLTGEHPFPDTPTGALLLKHVSQPLPLVHDSFTELPIEIDNLVQKATAKDPAARYADALSLAADFRRALRLEIEFPVTPQGELTNPFKGLRAFQESDSKHFFGRAALTTQLVEMLGEEAPHASFLAVVGPSGSGKSSVVKAGLLPALRQGALPGSGDWFIVSMIPGRHPLEELEIALLRVATNQNLELSTQLQRDARGLLRAARLVLPDDDQQLLLVIDQFEEVFSLADDPQEASHFMDLVYQAVSDPESPIRVVLTLRADFYDRPLMHPDLSTMMESRTALVLPMTPQELSEAIRCPAEQAGVVLAEGLATHIIADVVEQPGALPLLQYALTELFEQREGRRLTAEAYQELGGVLGALGKRAEQTYHALPVDLQALTRQVFLRLVTLGEGVEDTRRRVLQSELEALASSPSPGNGAGKQAVSEVLEAFSHARLLSFDRDPLTRGPTVEVAHEALLREWPRLCEWLDESRADIRSQRVLGNAAAEWLQAGREPSFLLRGTRLDQFAAWAESTDLALTQSEHEYLQACLAERRARETAEAERMAHEAALEKRSRNFLRVLVAVLGLAAVIALGLSLYAFNQQSIARDSAATATIAQGQAQVEAATAIAAQQEALIQAERADQAAGEAQAQRAIAEQESRAAREAYSLSLAASAQQALDANRPMTALALAMAANSIPDPPLEAQRILLEAAYAPGPRVPINSVEAFGEKEVYRFYLSPDGKTAISDVNGRKLWWDLDSQVIIQEFPDRQDYEDQVYFNQDRILVISTFRDGSMTLWDLVTGEDISHFQGHSNMVLSVDISPDERFLVSSSSHEIILWDLETGDEIRRLELFPPGESGTSVESYHSGILEFSSDNRTIVGNILIFPDEDYFNAWDVETGELINHIYVGGELAVNPDQMLVLSGLSNGLVELWDLETGQVIDSFDGYDNEHQTVVISPDGTRALFSAADGGILWDLVNREAMVYFDYELYVSGGSFSPDWRTVLSPWGDGDLVVGDLVPAHQVRQFASYFSPVSTLAVSPDGRYLLASGGSESRTAGAGEDVFRLWDIERGELLRTFTGHTAAVLTIDISPDSRLAASASADRSIKLWDLESGEELRTFLGHTDQVTGVAFSPDGKTLASSSRDRSLILWEIDTDEHKFIPTPDIEGLNDLDFSPHGQRLVSAGGSGITLWDAESGKLVSRIYAQTGTFDFPINEFATDTVVFSPDGERLISTSKTNGLHLWDVGTGEEIRQYQGLEKINSAAIRPDGRTALLGTENGLVILWDLQTGEVLRRFNGHNGHPILGAAFSPDGSSAFTAGEDGRIVQWSLDSPSSLEELLEWIENNRYVREFTCTERILYSVEPLCE